MSLLVFLAIVSLFILLLGVVLAFFTKSWQLPTVVMLLLFVLVCVIASLGLRSGTKAIVETYVIVDDWNGVIYYEDNEGHLNSLEKSNTYTVAVNEDSYVALVHEKFGFIWREELIYYEKAEKGRAK